MSVSELQPIVNAVRGLPFDLCNQGISDEHSLVANAKLGNDDAFGELYNRHQRKVYRTAVRILRNQQDAEDAVQRAFQRALVNLQRFREDSTFSTWLTRIVINEALMLLRQRRSNTRLLERDGDDHCDYESSISSLADKAPTPEEILARNELRAALVQAVSCLRKNLRIVVLPKLQGLTVRQTARHLGLSVAAVKARTFHAKQCLRQQLERRLQPERNSHRRKNSGDSICAVAGAIGVAEER